jgi:3-methyladenine DNA glycosylase AlkD
MELSQAKWTKELGKEFLKYLEEFKRNPEKQKWEQNIINTKYKCLAILSKDIKDITRKIAKGNFLSFLDLQLYNNFPVITIMGNLICKIKNFDIMKHYLDLYSNKVDNWANCDQLKFKITDSNKQDFLNLVDEYILSPLPFRRRIAIIILFQFIDSNINKIFTIADSLFNETEYYVNMAMSWLLCECFIKQKQQTISYLEEHKLNGFTINKMISKCCDSYRISEEDKEFLRQFKKNSKQ